MNLFAKQKLDSWGETMVAKVEKVEKDKSRVWD